MRVLQRDLAACGCLQYFSRELTGLKFEAASSFAQLVPVVRREEPPSHFVAFIRRELLQEAAALF